jgi:hypothetical protein
LAMCRFDDMDIERHPVIETILRLYQDWNQVGLGKWAPPGQFDFSQVHPTSQGT